ncbi:MAG: hypothetical protein ACYS30_20920 [Planctomycetota bacterium]
MKARRLLRLTLALMLLAVGCKKKPGEDEVTDISGPELAVINNSLKDYMFTEQDFNEPDRVWDFLQELASLHYDSYPLVASGGTLWSVKKDDISSWLKTKEKSEAVFRKLCPDPLLTLEANKWEIVFNVFRRDGGVDKWQVRGEHYPEERYNQIEKIKISTLKPKGTFFCPLMG